jgi:hypothetical protein
MNDVWKSTDGGLTWTETSNATWGVLLLGQHSVVVSGNTVIMAGGEDLYSGYVPYTWKYRAGSTTSACIITSATSGDIYNIGGISGESTKNIVFTLWENSGYGRGDS